jgi:hypothetical protein
MLVCYHRFMGVKTFATLKQAEARARMSSLRRARKSRRAAEVEQQRSSLVDGSKYRITNLAQVMRAMAR